MRLAITDSRTSNVYFKVSEPNLIDNMFGHLDVSQVFKITYGRR